jgi:hypothetical protein
MKKLIFLFIIVSVLFISCDKCIEIKEVDCSGKVFDKHYKSSWVQPIVHSTGKVTSVTYVTHPAQYNVYFYATPMNVRIEGQINNKTLYNNCSNGDTLTCYYIQRTYQKKDNSRYMTFSDLRLRYYFDED